MHIQQVRRILFGVVTTVVLVFGAAPIQVGSAASNRDASAIAALDAIPAEDWLKQSSGALLDRVITASSKESLDAAAARDPRAQALVGSAHLAGLHGYAKSETEAVKFYRLAADSNPIAQNNLGNLLLSGVANGGKPAPAEAAGMFRRAAKLGHPVAQANLGRLYADGVGVEKDVAKAKEFLTLAAAQGNSDAIDLLHVLESREAAEKWKRLEAAAATGDADALHELAEAYEEIDKRVFGLIKTNQLQAAVNASLRAPDREKLRYAQLADEHGMTALHWTVENRNAAGVRWLLDKGAGLELKDDQGRTPLKIALDNKDIRAMTLLIDRGAKTSTALPGYDDELKVLKKTNDIVDFMTNTAACEAGGASACSILAAIYAEGRGVAKDEAKAAVNYTKACDGGIATACTSLGYYYEHGQRGVPQDLPKAASLYAKVCSPEEPVACLNLGVMYRNGRGVAKDPAKAAALYTVACDTGKESRACNNLGLLHNNGEGVAKNQPKAAALFVSACDAGNAFGCHNLAVLTMNGEGVPKDDAKAVALLQKACAGDYAPSCSAVGSRYFGGNGLPKDPSKATTHFEKACTGNDGPGCYFLGLMLDGNHGGVLDKARAATLFAKACELGEQRACTRNSTTASEPAKPSKAPATAAAAPIAASPANAACRIAKVQPGVDTVASVERDIKARGGERSTGGTGLHKFRISALSGDYRDVGTEIMAVNYDFDAAGPAGRLVAVTIVNHANTGPGYEKLLAERKAAAATVVAPLQQKSATEFTASAPNCKLRFLPNADTWFIHEVYQLAN